MHETGQTAARRTFFAQVENARRRRRSFGVGHFRQPRKASRPLISASSRGVWAAQCGAQDCHSVAKRARKPPDHVVSVEPTVRDEGHHSPSTSCSVDDEDRRRIGGQLEVREKGHDHLALRDVSEVLLILPLLAPGTLLPPTGTLRGHRAWEQAKGPSDPSIRAGRAADCRPGARHPRSCRRRGYGSAEPARGVGPEAGDRAE